MFEFVKKMFFGELFPEIKPNTIYESRIKGTNPFARPEHRVRVKAVKNGWVNYTWLSKGTIWDDESMTLANFRNVYPKLIGKYNESI